MKEKINKYLSEAGIISLIIVFSYIVYLSGEIGYLEGYNIIDLNSLIPLDIQSVIMGFIKAIFYMLIFILIIVFLIKVFLRDKDIERSLYNKYIFCLMVILCSVVVPELVDRYGVILGMLAYILVMGVSYMLIFLKLFKMKKSIFELMGLPIEKILNKVTKKQKNKLIIYCSIVFLLYTPILNFIISYDEVSISHSGTYMFLKIENVNYLVIRQYSDKTILVEFKNGKLIPNYRILKEDDLSGRIYHLEKRVIDNNSLF